MNVCIALNLICWLDASNPIGPVNFLLAALLVGFQIGRWVDARLGLSS